MKTLSSDDLNTLTKLINSTEKETANFLSEKLEEYYPKEKIVKENKYIYAIGTIPILLVAHMDTVFERDKRKNIILLYDEKINAMCAPLHGAGFDDKAGIFSILKILEEGYRPSVAFTVGEEIGGIGANEFSSLECPFKNLSFIIELDRAGSKDCVFYDCDNEDFVKYIEAFGFKKAIGSFTDISFLAPAWKVAAVNLSIGYLLEHTKSETLVIDVMFNTIEKVKNILKQSNIKKFSYIPSINSIDFLFKDIPLETDPLYSCNPKKCNCDLCNKEQEDKYDLYPIMTKGKPIYACLDCLTNPNINWCSYCNEPYIGDSGVLDTCYECAEDLSNYAF